MNGRKVVAAMLGAALAVPVSLVAFKASGLLINVSESAPVGIWRKAPELPIERGRHVLLCADKQFGFLGRYLHSGPCPNGLAQLLKPVVAMAGDSITIDASGVRVNGLAIQGATPLWADAAGRPLQPIVVSGRVPVGMVYVISNHSPYSIDSRYLGAVSLSSIETVAIPVMVDNHEGKQK